MFAHRASAGTGDEDAARQGVEVTDFRFETLQKAQNCFGLFGVMPLIVRPKELLRGRIEHDRFGGCGADIDSDRKFSPHVSQLAVANLRRGARPAAVLILCAMCRTKFAATPTTPW